MHWPVNEHPQGGEDLEWLHGPPSWTRTPPEDTTDARHLLSKHVQSLRRRGYRWLAVALWAYLNQPATSLEEALGLVHKPKRGRPRDQQVAKRDVHVMRLFAERHTWEEIERRTKMNAEDAQKLVSGLTKPRSRYYARAVDAFHELPGEIQEHFLP